MSGAAGPGVASVEWDSHRRVAGTCVKVVLRIEREVAWACGLFRRAPNYQVTLPYDVGANPRTASFEWDRGEL